MVGDPCSEQPWHVFDEVQGITHKSVAIKARVVAEAASASSSAVEPALVAINLLQH